MRHSELLAALEERVPDRIDEVLDELVADRRVRVVERSGVRFWKATGGPRSKASSRASR
jgi:hypothetical protein